MKSAIAFGSIFLLTVGLSAQTKAPMTNAERLASLQLSKMCSDEGKRFVAGIPKIKQDEITSSSTHYNRARNQCMVEVSKYIANTDKDGNRFTISSQEIYNSIDDVVLASFVTMTTKSDTTVMSCQLESAAGELLSCASDNRLVETARSLYEQRRNKLIDRKSVV